MHPSKIVILITAAAFAAPASAATLVYGDFSDTSGLQINGSSAAVSDGTRTVLRVTPSLFNQSGSVFSTSPITLGSEYSFSTRFTFNFNNPQAGGADGLVFVVQPNSNTVGGLGGGIGYSGIPNSLGVEFDNWNNGSVDSNSDNHIGVDLNGNIASSALILSPFTLDGGTDLTAWVDYNGALDLLEVRFNNSAARPVAPLLSYTVDLAAVIGNPNAFVGFTSGTGSAAANHDVINWEFRDVFAPIDVDGAVPEPSTWAMMLLGFGFVGGAMRAARRRLKLTASYAE